MGTYDRLLTKLISEFVASRLQSRTWHRAARGVNLTLAYALSYPSRKLFW